MIAVNICTYLNDSLRICTACPRSTDPLHIVSYYIKSLLLGHTYKYPDLKIHYNIVNCNKTITLANVLAAKIEIEILSLIFVVKNLIILQI